mmetsp:Transcript_27007/g.61394  ORF Transcript_27007/g.61394 Transcript_27007/m.61394 type:complete len:130 (-) Transcript_27007:197-586(-)
MPRTKSAVAAAGRKQAVDFSLEAVMEGRTSAETFIEHERLRQEALKRELKEMHNACMELLKAMPEFRAVLDENLLRNAGIDLDEPDNYDPLAGMVLAEAPAPEPAAPPDQFRRRHGRRRPRRCPAAAGN